MTWLSAVRHHRRLPPAVPTPGALALLLPLVLAACGPSKTPPVQMVVNVLAGTGKYEPRQVSLDTLTDVVGMKGSVAELIGGARIVLNSEDPLLKNATGPLTDEQVANILLKNKGLTPAASYVEKDGVLWPADFNTWNMGSTYYNFEKAFDFYQGLGVPSSELTQTRVYYFAEFVDVQSHPTPETGNALFFSPVQAFIVLPYDPPSSTTQEKVPLSMNYGIIAHEYSHRVFNKRVYSGQAFPDPIVNWNGRPLNLLKAIDEGFADWNGWGATCESLFGCNTRFIEPSLGQPIADARDLAKNDKCVTSGLLNQYSADSTEQWTSFGLQYTLGTVFASSLWHAANSSGQKGVIQRALLASYSDISVTSPGIAQLIQDNLNTADNFTIEAVVRSILQHTNSSEVRKALCAEFLDRLKVNPGLVPECNSYASNTNCPALQ